MSLSMKPGELFAPSLSAFQVTKRCCFPSLGEGAVWLRRRYCRLEGLARLRVGKGTEGNLVRREILNVLFDLSWELTPLKAPKGAHAPQVATHKP